MFLTQFDGSNNVNGGPTIIMNNKDTTVFTNKEDLPGVTIRFIWENPLSLSLEEMATV
jgi:hypothetical protein